MHVYICVHVYYISYKVNTIEIYIFLKNTLDRCISLSLCQVIDTKVKI